MSSKKNKQKRNISFKKKKGGDGDPTQTITITSDQNSEVEPNIIGTRIDYRRNKQPGVIPGEGPQLDPIKFSPTMDAMIDDMEKLKYSYDYLLGICQGNCSDCLLYTSDAADE